jgi:hypothetical protein
MSDIIEVDLNTGQVTEREYTQEEIDYKVYLESQVTIPEPIVDANEEIRESALAKLTALGLTEAEAKAIVGL